ncbi:surfeit locus protein 2 [Ipomoea triloba]|uniref:surfeit locus protein 2 n=1 Tax=Ipomoea triloba TaxID=35885 RepID=UPI00125E9A76|nr:surfeit locus protein 2 [Ipomoea triloba]
MAKEEGGGAESGEKEGQNLLGEPTFKKLENGRFKCVETGHELPAHARDSYARSKHCRLGLIDAALASKKPPLNMFSQDPLSKSKLKCKLTGLTVNKSEEHIWKHINGKRFLRMLEKKEAEQEMPDRMVEEKIEQVQEKPKKKSSSLKKKKKEKAENATNIVSEMRDITGNDSDPEEAEFWMPPVGERWDFDDGGNRWGSGSESEPENDDANGEDELIEEATHEAGELSKQTKRMTLEIGPSSFARRKKKKKTNAS